MHEPTRGRVAEYGQRIFIVFVLLVGGGPFADDLLREKAGGFCEGDAQAE
jgi:hypothetical protein